MDKHKSAPGLAQVPPGIPTETPDGRTFIGGKSQEFQGKSQPKTHTQPQPQPQSSEEPKQSEDKIICSRCGSSLNDEFIFCPTCGLEQEYKNLCRALNIELTQEDLSEYLFKGYLVKEVPLVHGKKALFKTLLPMETEQIEGAMMEQFGEIKVTNNLYMSMYSMRALSHGWIKFDGNSLGDTPEKRLDHIRNKTGGHLVDLASKVWSQFNRAVIAMLEDSEILKN